jgi:ATP-dependent exoDNAse (exonuclease V) alpha subunit
MAMYHCHLQIINRSSGRSSVAAAAYRSANKLHNQRDGLTHDYTKKGGVVFSQVILPDTAPQAFANRETLWNAVEKSEKRSDAQTAREIEVALPVELTHAEQINLVREYIAQHFTTQGMIADFAIHDKKDSNPHAHIMLTLRTVTIDGFGKKERAWNERQNCEYWREKWADIYNRQLQEKGISERVDHRSFKRQGIELEPTIHLGTTANQLEKMGIPTERGETNRQIQKRNQALLELTQLQETKNNLISQEQDRLSTLKNNYLDLALQIQKSKSQQDAFNASKRQSSAERDDLLERKKFLENLQKRQRKLQSLLLDDNAKRQLSSLENSERQALRALERDYQLTPDKIPQAIESVSRKSAEASHELLQIADLSLLDKLLSSMLSEFLEAWKELASCIEPAQISLDRLSPFPQNPALSPEQLWALTQAENQLKIGAQSLTRALKEQSLDIEPPGLSLGR